MLNLQSLKEKLNNTNGDIQEQFLKIVQEDIDANAKFVPKTVIASLERFFQLSSNSLATYVLVNVDNEDYLLWCRELICSAYSSTFCRSVEIHQVKTTKILEEIQHTQSRLNSLADFFSK